MDAPKKGVEEAEGFLKINFLADRLGAKKADSRGGEKIEWDI